MKNTISSIKPFRILLKNYGIKIIKRIGINVLSKEETINYLIPFQQRVIPQYQLSLQQVADVTNPFKILFTEQQVQISPSYVWQINKSSKQAVILQCGAVLINNKFLRTDFTIHASFNLFIRRKRAPYHAKLLIAPWSQYFKEARSEYAYVSWITFGGYYDFMILFATKLCRIMDTLPESALAEAVVTYPLLNMGYERDVLTLLGFKPHQVLDSQAYKVSFDTCLFGSSESWCYPNIADIVSLKRRIEKRVPIEHQGHERRRIYVSRANRRRIINEEALIDLLIQYGFIVIEDIPRTVAEQVAIFRNASFIIGPHGAAFTNIIWCEQDTHLLELFSPNYAPNYFAYLAKLLDLRYSAYCHGSPVKVDIDALTEDVYVSITDLNYYLASHFKQETLKNEPV